MREHIFDASGFCTECGVWEAQLELGGLKECIRRRMEVPDSPLREEVEDVDFAAAPDFTPGFDQPAEAPASDFGGFSGGDSGGAGGGAGWGGDSGGGGSDGGGGGDGGGGSDGGSGDS